MGRPKERDHQRSEIAIRLQLSLTSIHRNLVQEIARMGQRFVNGTYNEDESLFLLDLLAQSNLVGKAQAINGEIGDYICEDGHRKGKAPALVRSKEKKTK